MGFSQEFNIAGKQVDALSPVFIIAEAGVNHNGCLDTARRLIDVAVEAGADAVKFQQFKSEALVLASTAQAQYQIENLGEESSQLEMLKKLEISILKAKELQDYCQSKGIVFLTTPFDEQSLAELDDLDLPAYKISSTDLTNLPFLVRVAQKRKPIILSTGMSFMSEIALALEAIAPYNNQVLLLQCHSDYPTQDSDVNLNVLKTFQEQFGVLVGFSDHTHGIGASPYSVTLGAKVIEKHFTLDKTMPGPDHQASLEPGELIEFVKQVRRVERYMGSSIKKPSISELNTRQSLQKCLVASAVIKQGEVFSEKNLVAKRTGGNGISPIYIGELMGRKAAKDFEPDEVITL